MLKISGSGSVIVLICFEMLLQTTEIRNSELFMKFRECRPVHLKTKMVAKSRLVSNVTYRGHAAILAGTRAPGSDTVCAESVCKCSELMYCVHNGLKSIWSPGAPEDVTRWSTYSRVLLQEGEISILFLCRSGGRRAHPECPNDVPRGTSY